MQGMFEGGFQGEKRHQLGNQTQRDMGHPSLLSKEAGRYNGRRNADKLTPGEVLPPCVETESRLLEKNRQRYPLVPRLGGGGAEEPRLRLPQRGDLPPGGRGAAERKRRVRDSRGGQKSGG